MKNPSGDVPAAKNNAAAKLNLLHRTLVEGMPGGDSQEVRTFSATLDPGDLTPRHTHPFPVTVHILEGEFTLELEGQEPLTVRRGETCIEPPHVRMIGRNRSSAERTTMLLFYVSTPGAPFAEIV